MKYIVDKPLSEFEFWGAAADHAKLLSNSELDCIGEFLEDEAPRMTETEINDLFAFRFNDICEIIGETYDETD